MISLSIMLHDFRRHDKMNIVISCFWSGRFNVDKDRAMVGRVISVISVIDYAVVRDGDAAL